MAKTINTKFLGAGHEEYTIRNLNLPNSYDIMKQELNMPLSWSKGSPFFTNDSDFINNFESDMNIDNVKLLRKSIKDDENLLRLIIDIIGYGKEKIYGYSNYELNRLEDYQYDEEESPTFNKILKILNTNEMNPSPADYEYNTKKRGGWGYSGYGSIKELGKGKTRPKPKKEIINHKIEDFVTPSWIMSEDDKSDKLKEETEFHSWWSTHTKLKNPWIFAELCSPIIQEIRAFNNPGHLRRISEYQTGYTHNPSFGKIMDIRNNMDTLLVRRAYIYDNIQLRGDYANNKEVIKSKELLINSPLMNIGFFENMQTYEINSREWRRWINRRLGDLEDCVIPQLELPDNKPFILINYATDLVQPWEGMANIDIYLIFNKISFKDYRLNVNKSYSKGEWHKLHQFNRRGPYSIKDENKQKRFLDKNIYLGYHIQISNDEFQTSNYFGPIDTPIHPLICREVMGEWEEEDNFPIEHLFYKYKIIELKDIYKKIVNWPRTKPMELR